MKVYKNKFLYVTITTLVFLIIPFGAQAAINPMINYQGRLTDSSGNPVSNGDYNMRFRLYTVASGGSPIFTETLTGNNRIGVVSGLFSVMVGSSTAITSVDFNQTLYLGVEIGGTDSVTPSWDGEMSPRKIIGSVPTAFVADTLDGIDSTQFLRNDTSGTLSGNLLVTGSTTLQNFTGQNATTTNFSVTNTNGFSLGGLANTLLSVNANGTVIATSTIGNNQLQNSTISGIALGSNLANLSATDSTLTFSGTYNGGTARTIGLNLSNANNWTGLQTFTNASSTLLSSTIASTSQLILSGASNGCLQVNGGNVTSTGVACGTGGGSFAFPWTTLSTGEQATSTTISFQNGLLSTASSTFTGSTTLARTLMGNATSTSLYVSSYFAGAGLSTCNTSSDKLLWLSGTFSCGTDQTGGGGGTDVNWTFFNGSGIRLATTTNQVLIGFTSTSSLSKLEVVGGATIDNSTTTSATTTALYVSGLASTTNFRANSAVFGDITVGSCIGCGGGSSNSKWATTTDNLSIYTNSALYTGIGTSSPKWLLQLSTSTAPQLTLSDSTAGSQGWAFRNLDGNLFISSTSPTTYATGTTPAITITKSGTIGFNNQTPTRNLSINSNAGNNASIALTALTGSSFITFSSATTNWSAGLDLSASNNFKISNASSIGTTDRLTINSSGSIGIGTTTPQWLLQLSTSSAPQLALSDSGSITSNIWTFRNSGGLLYLATSSPTTFATSSVSALTINENGVVSIANSATTSEIRSNTGIIGYITSIFGSFTNLLVNGSTTLQNFTAVNATTTSATTTGFALTGVTSSILKTNSSGSVLAAVSGTDYQSPVSATYPVLFNSNTISLAFGTTTNNSWSGQQTFLASTTLQNFTAQNSTSTSATTTTLYVSGLASTTSLRANGAMFGNVGIGTTTPQWIAQISSSVGPQLTLSDSTAGTDHWSFRNVGGFLYLATSSPTTFATTSISALSLSNSGSISLNPAFNAVTVNSSGQVGIRTASPLTASTFHINRDASASNSTNGVFMLGTTALSSPSADGTYIGLNALSSFIGNVLDYQLNGSRLLSINSSGEITTIGGTTANITGTQIALYRPSASVTIGNSGDFGTGSSLVVQAGAGGVGANLDFQTDAVTRARVNYLGFGIGTTTPRFLLQLSTTSAPQLAISDSGSITANHWTLNNVNGVFYLATSSPTSFATSSVAAIAINTNGAVGIGSTTPAYKLDVAGFINTSMYGGFKQEGHTILFASTTNFSTLVGQQAGQNLLTDGMSSTAVGYQALRLATSSDNNTAVGYLALSSNTIGTTNTAVGTSALASNNIGSDNTAVGRDALTSATVANLNTAVGQRALRFTTTGGFNTAVGGTAMTTNLTGDQNIAVGYAALAESITGRFNVSIGVNSLTNNQSATTTVAIGHSAAAGGANYTNQNGVYIGYQSGVAVITGSDNNTFVGYNSGQLNSSGANNTLFGYQAGNTLTTGSGNLIIGYDADSLALDTNNFMNIGNLIYGANITGTGINPAGFLGVGTTTPRFLMQLATSTAPQLVLSDPTAGTNAWAFRSVGGLLYLATSSPTSFATSSIAALTIDGTTGNVGIGTTTPGAKLNVVGALCVDDSTPTCGNAARTEGTIYSVAALSASLDLAESYPTKDATLSAGEIVMLDAGNNMFVSRAVNGSQMPLVGIVSTNPGFWLGGFNDDVFKNDKKLPIALSGRVPTKVNNEGGSIKVGDRITLSGVAGVGKKATSTDYTVGIALESMNDTSGTIEVFVNLDNPEKPIELVNLENRVNVLEASLANASLAISTTTDDQTLVGSILEAIGAVVNNGVLYLKNLVVETLTVGKPDKPSGITLYDSETGSPYCLSILNGIPVSRAGVCGSQTNVPESNTSQDNGGDTANQESQVSDEGADSTNSPESLDESGDTPAVQQNTVENIDNPPTESTPQE